MDFEYLLELAKQNEDQNKSQKRMGFSTKVSAAKKISRPAPKGTAIKAFLAKQEHEKKKKEEEERKKKENLLALRAQDRKSNKRVKAMINRTKGACKAVLEDAKDLSTSHAEPQCDEDDYGYESTVSQAIFSKLANDYACIPEDERLKFVKKEKGSIDDIKNRVINSLKKEEEEEMGPRKRKRKRKNQEGDEFINDGDEYDDCEDLLSSSKEKDREKEKASENAPKLPVNFNVTNYKSDKYENFKYEKEKHKKKDKHRDKEERHKEREERHREKEEERHREKEERHREKEERHKEREEKREKHKENKEKKFIKPKNKSQGPPPMSFEQLLKMAQTKKVAMGDDLESLQPEKMLDKNKDKDKKNDRGRPLTAKEKEEQEEERLRKLRRMGKLPPLQPKVEKADKDKEKVSKLEAALTKDKGDQDGNKAFKNGAKSSKLQIPQPYLKDKGKAPEKEVKEESKVMDRSKYFATAGGQKQKPRPIDNAPQQLSKASNKMPPPVARAPKEAAKFKELESSRFSSKGANASKGPLKSRDFPPKDVRQFPPPDVHRRGPPPNVRRGPSSASAYRGRIESDDEEEDDEMDDFIDDGEEDDSYSSEIAKIFGYDKSRFRDEDDDIDDMEVSFSQVQKEERISAKIGLKEDLEDIKREEEERKRKMMKKKQMAKMKR